MWWSTTACGTMRLPLLTLGLFSCRSLNLRALGDFGFDAAALLVVRCAFVEDAFDGDEKFGEVCRGPFRKAPNKRLNHCQTFTYENTR